ncbi:MAG: NAD(P)/FAD-dependent oxidoreductase [Candidatus Aenigmarchaeota archaeon]|nr:NAD(P)/FAD-dependent oxidoreductase [Candidatus Aenigmarchaeota archaeon]
MRQFNILGAGLSGLSAAINLAEAGFKVNVFDVRKDSGARFEGDLQGLENWTNEISILEDLKEMNIKVNFHCNPFKKVFLTDGRKTSEINFSRPMFYLVKRGTMVDSIDQGLKRQAIDKGVQISYNTKFESKADIIATGPKPSGRLFGIDRGIVFDTEIEDTAVAIVNTEATYKAYSYLLVTEGYGCIATVLYDKFHLVNKCLERTKEIAIKLFDVKIKNEKGVGGIGNFIYPQKLQENDSLFVGEAGGLQEALWGFGMRYAMTSGYLAANSITQGLQYKKLVDEKFDNQFKASIVNRFMWEIMIGKAINWLKFNYKTYSKKDTLKFFNKLYNFTLTYQKLLYPIAYLWFKSKYKGVM